MNMIQSIKNIVKKQIVFADQSTITVTKIGSGTFWNCYRDDNNPKYVYFFAKIVNGTIDMSKEILETLYDNSIKSKHLPAMERLSYSPDPTVFRSIYYDAINKTDKILIKQLQSMYNELIIKYINNKKSSYYTYDILQEFLNQAKPILDNEQFDSLSLLIEESFNYYNCVGLDFRFCNFRKDGDVLIFNDLIFDRNYKKQ